ncbi:HD domain-containing protein [Microcoleus sp. FACHB-1515]|uniref:HD domain-containing protein n=1 Tax=Cyanophyceae TaxID=3028117 RepID=UPI0016883798|nr:HD domain-containing protein [Microcoleus sp. FACHB-1515]MBD2092344.1 HD domain-containing protein [Microcoleus sp. FACHB-1515]
MIDRLAQQIQFILEIDKLKTILRQTRLADGSRRENSAEHSWHLALMAILLSEYAAEAIDPLRVVTMLLIHDLVEIDAGDTFAFDVKGNLDKAALELAAADRIFNLLPSAQAAELRSLWEEFEAQNTAEAKYAAALDRLQPLLLNQQNQGGTWREHGITKAQVIKRVEPIATATPELWPLVEAVIAQSIAAGYLKVDQALPK